MSGIQRAIERALHAKAGLEERAAALLDGAEALGNGVVALCEAHELPVPDRAVGFGFLDKCLVAARTHAANLAVVAKATGGVEMRATLEKVFGPDPAPALTPGQQRVRRAPSLTPEQHAEKARYYSCNQARRRNGLANLAFEEYQRRVAVGEVVSNDGPRKYGGRPRGPRAKKSARRRR